MKKFFITCLMLCSFMAATANAGTPTSSDRTEKGLRFTENRGQVTDTRGNARPDVLYTAENQGVKIFFRNDAVSYVFPQIENVGGESKVTALFRSDIEFVGANPNFRVVSENPVEGVSNFFLGQGKGVAGARSFSKITYKNLYPNVDLVFFASGNGKSQMKYEFVVRPGGKVEDIKLRYNGASKVSLNRDGSLETVTPFGKLGEDAPYTYQAGKTIASNYQLNNGVLTYSVGDYDKNADLVIDPLTRPFATNWGGSLFDRALGNGIDNAGNIAITGTTASVNFPTTPGAVQATKGNNNDAFVSVINADGTVRFTTYFGGNNTDQGNDAAFDQNGNVLVVGYTVSTDLLVGGGFQSTPGGSGDGFAISLSATGGLNWSSYWGGAAQDELRGVAIWPNGDLFTAGRTFSANLSTVGGPINGNRDAFAARIRANGSLAWGTYFGGSGDDQGFAVAVDAAGDMVVTGSTTSTNNIATPGAAQAALAGGSDAFVVKFNGQGARQWSTYLGGAGSDFANGIATGPNNSVFITGQTGSSNFPTTNNASQRTFGGVTDAFVGGMNANGGLVLSSFLGGQSSEQGFGIAVTGGKVYAAGTTNSTNFPIINPNADNTLPFQGSVAGNFDVFLAKWDAGTGAREWTLAYGGSSDDVARDLAANGSGALAIVGYTNSGNFPTRNRIGNTNAATGNDDAIVISLRDDVTGCPAINVSAEGSNPTCAGNDGRITVTAAGATSFSINGGAFATNNVFTGLSAGNYTVTARNAEGCTGTSSVVTLTQTNSASFMVNVAQANNLRCNGDRTQLTVNVMGGGTAPFTYQLNNGTPQIQNVFTNVMGGAYSVTVKDANNCVVTTSGMVMEPRVITFQALITDANCTTGTRASVTVNATGGGTPPYQYSINGGASFQSSNMFMNLMPMPISVVIRDANNCLSEIENKDIRSTGGVMISNTANTDPTCGGLANGAITVTATSGSLPYTFSLDNGTAPRTLSAASTTFNGLAGGNYVVTVRDNRGCIDTRTVQLNDPAPLSIPAVSGVQPSSCSATNGTIVVNALGGRGGYMYSIDGGESFQMNNTFFGIGAGQYSIVVRDQDNGPTACTATSMYTVSQLGGPKILDAGTSTRDPFCSGSSFANTGEITIQATGTGSLSLLYYSIDGGLNWNTSSTGSYTFFGLSPGNYSVRVAESPNAACYDTRMFTLMAPTPIQARTVVTQPSCGMNAMGGTLTVSASGGQGSYEYSIDGGTTWRAGLSDMPVVFENLFPNNSGYMVIARDQNGCTDEDGPYNMVNPSGLNLMINENTGVVAPTCGRNDGRITVIPTGGTLPRTFTLRINGTVVQQTTNSNSSFTFTGLTEGIHDIEVSDAGGCKVMKSIDLQVLRLIPITVTPPACGIDDNIASLTGSIAVNIIGGVGPFEYSINGSRVTTTGTLSPFAFRSLAVNSRSFTFTRTNNSANNNVLGNISPGVYTIRVRDVRSSNNCVAETTLVIGSRPTPAIASVSSVVINNGTCLGNDASLTVNYTTTTGFTVARATLVRTDGFVLTTTTVGPPLVVTGIPAGTYRAFLSDAAGCFLAVPNSMGEFDHVVNQVNPVRITAVDVTQPNCTTTPLGSLRITATGGTNLEYRIVGQRNNEGTVSAWQLSPVFDNINPNTTIPTTNIQVREIGTGATCRFDWPNAVSFIRTSNLTAGITAATPPTCANASNGRITVSIIGGTSAPYSYFINGRLAATTNATTFEFTGLQQAVYTVLVRDANGCGAAEFTGLILRNFPLLANPTDGFTATPTAATNCNNGTIDLAFTGTWTTATDLQVSLNGGATFSAPGAEAALDALLLNTVSPGTYNVVVKRLGDNCMQSRTVTVIGTLGASGYFINNTTIKQPGCPGSSDGTVSVTVTFTSLNGAAANRFIRIRRNGIAGTILMSQENISATGTFTVTVPGLNAGTYFIEIRNGAAACVSSIPGTFDNVYSTVLLSNPVINPIVFSGVNVVNPDCITNNNGILTLNASGGNGTLEYSIDGGLTWQTSNVFSNLTPRIVRNSNIRVRQQGTTCTTSEVQLNGGIGNTNVLSPTGLSISAVVTQPGCDVNAQNNTGTIIISNTGTRFPINVFVNNETAPRFTFPGNEATGTLTGLATGTYAFRAVDAAGCVFNTNVTIQNSSISFQTIPSNPTTCGGSNGNIRATFVGGTPNSNIGLVNESSNREFRIVSNGVIGEWMMVPVGGLQLIENLSAGVYILEGRNVGSNCISTSNTIFLQDPNSPAGVTLSANPPSNLNCNNGSVIVNLSGNNTSNLRFEISNDQGLNWSPNGGQTNRFFTNLREATYYVRVRSGLNAPFCYRYAGPVNLRCTSGGTRIAGTENLNNLSVYPNPTKGQFSINYTSFSNEAVKAVLIDATGRTIANYNFTAVEGENAFDVDLTNHTSGIYLLQVTTGDNINTVKVVKE